MTLLRPSLGTSADIAVRHRIKPERRGCVSSARSAGVVLGPLVKKSYLVMRTCLNHLSHFKDLEQGCSGFWSHRLLLRMKIKSKREKLDFVTKLHVKVVLCFVCSEEMLLI